MNPKMKRLKIQSLEQKYLYAISLTMISVLLSFVLFTVTSISRNIVDTVEPEKIGFLSFIICFFVFWIVLSIASKIFAGDYAFGALPWGSFKADFRLYVWAHLAIIFSAALVYLGSILTDVALKTFALNGANIVMFSFWAAGILKAVLNSRDMAVADRVDQ